MIENHRQEEVLVVINEVLEYHMRPCSVLIEHAVRPPVARLPIEVKDAGGETVYRTEFDLASGEHPWRVEFSVPGDPPSGCPAAVQGKLMLVVRNYRPRTVEIWLDGERLGPVEPRSATSFGPLDASWEDVARMEVKDPRGGEIPPRYFGYSADYDLGEVPEVLVDVMEP